MKYTITYFVNLVCACLLLVCLFWFSACRKFTEVKAPPDLVNADVVFTSDQKATSAITAIYGSMINGSVGFANVLTTVYTAYSADELLRFNPPLTQQEFSANTLAPGNAQVKNLWNSIFKHIYYANSVLEGLQRSTAVTPAVKTRLVAEAKFIRAFCYYYAVNLWGDVPLLTTTDYHTNAISARSPVTHVLAAIESDLLDAKAGLPTPATTDKSRPSTLAAAAFLARLYLQQQNWIKATSEADEVLSSGMYTPLPPTNLVFLANAKEAIWQLMPTSGYLKETSELRPIAGAPQNTMTTALVNAFDLGDARRTKWIDSITYQSVKYYYPAKYRNTTNTVTEHYTILRAAEQFLIRAEARLNNNDSVGALADINSIKARAGVAPLPATATKAQIAAAIEKERRLELFVEWGHRWFDLKRWNKLSQVKPSAQPYAWLYPLPQDELLLNPFLTQNPGY